MSLIQITAYVRDEETLAKWKALPNKTEWLHKQLNDNHQPDAFILSPKIAEEHPELVAEFDKLAYLVDDEVEGLALDNIIRTNFSGTAKDRIKPVPKGSLTYSDKPPAICEHFQPKGQCLVKGCKYGKGKK